MKSGSSYRDQEGRPALTVLEGGRSRDQGVNNSDLAKSVILGSGIVATGLVVVALFTGNSDKPSTTAICEGTQPHTIAGGEGTSHLLARIEGGIANPEDATAKIQQMNPEVNPERFESSLLPVGVTVRIPEACFSEDANRLAR